MLLVAVRYESKPVQVPSAPIILLVSVALFLLEENGRFTRSLSSESFSECPLLSSECPLLSLPPQKIIGKFTIFRP